MTERANELPSGAGDLARKYPAIWRAYSDLGEACAVAGPLEGKVLRLVKLALAIGISSEGAVHSHARRAPLRTRVTLSSRGYRCDQRAAPNGTYHLATESYLHLPEKRLRARDRR